MQIVPRSFRHCNRFVSFRFVSSRGGEREREKIVEICKKFLNREGGRDGGKREGFVTQWKVLAA